MIKRIILVGKSAAGKDYARKQLEDIGLIYGVSYTTRPAREGEVDGVDYNFLSLAKFEEMIDSDEWYEYVQFNGWYYGTSNKQFYEGCQVFIMTPHGISLIKEKDRSSCMIAYLDIPFKIRKGRLIERKDNSDKISRRLAADEVDFMDFIDWDVKVMQDDFCFYELLDHAILKQIIFDEHIITKINNNYEYPTK